MLTSVGPRPKRKLCSRIATRDLICFERVRRVHFVSRQMFTPPTGCTRCKPLLISDRLRDFRGSVQLAIKHWNWMLPFVFVLFSVLFTTPSPRRLFALGLVSRFESVLRSFFDALLLRALASILSVNTIHLKPEIHEQIYVTKGYGKLCTTTSTFSPMLGAL